MQRVAIPADFHHGFHHRHSGDRTAQPQSSGAPPPATHRGQLAGGGGLVQRVQSPGPNSEAAFSNCCSAVPPTMMPRHVRAAPAVPVASRWSRPSRISSRQQHTANPRYLKQEVSYDGNERPGTVIIDTRNACSTWCRRTAGRSATASASAGPASPGPASARSRSKREWPDWTPPTEMLKRRPDLPRHMEGGLDNPLGARAMYLGSTLYRIHGSNEPWTIGNGGVVRLHPHAQRGRDRPLQRVKVGTKVMVI